MFKAIKNTLIITLIYLAVGFAFSYLGIQLAGVHPAFSHIAPIVSHICIALAIIWVAEKIYKVKIWEKLADDGSILGIILCFIMGFCFFPAISYLAAHLVRLVTQRAIGFNTPFAPSPIYLLYCIVVPVCICLEYNACAIDIGKKSTSKMSALIIAIIMLGVANFVTQLNTSVLNPTDITILLFSSLSFAVCYLLAGYVYVKAENFYYAAGIGVGGSLHSFTMLFIRQYEGINAKLTYLETSIRFGQLYFIIALMALFALCFYFFKRLYMD
ncbi:MAG: hypothetical protein IJR47_05280 [Clostridia bacterium]|nr:hypothetical protein [Clostridia bacterium]